VWLAALSGSSTEGARSDEGLWAGAAPRWDRPLAIGSRPGRTDVYDVTVVTQPKGGRPEQQWVLLAYRFPREPSTPRIAVWRRLKRLGVAQLLDGLVALPHDARNREQLEWIADDVVEAGGQATMWIGRLASRADERSIVRDLADAVAVEYRKLIDEARVAGAMDDVVGRRTLARLRRELRRIRQRDYFPPPEAQQARAAVESLAALEEVRA
jgi:Protein ChrB, N-terminal